MKLADMICADGQESEDEAPQSRNRRSGGKRVSTITRTTQEGEALLKVQLLSSALFSSLF